MFNSMFDKLNEVKYFKKFQRSYDVTYFKETEK